MSEAVSTYRAASSATRTHGRIDLRLASEVGEPALFFDGMISHPEASAAALLLVGKIARTRFYLPPGMVAAQIAAGDPVVTASPRRLRFESFSVCCGVAARYDILEAGLDPPPLASGTTNVDLNPPVREVLAQLRGRDPLHLAVGTDVTVTTATDQIVERKVPLPTRWVRGFAEAQAASSRLVERAVLTPGQARRLLGELPVSSNGRSVLYLVPGRDGFRLSATLQPEAVAVGGPSRLRVLDALLAHADRLIVYGPMDAATGVSVWQLDLPDARFCLTLSPSSMRGFSGEGGLLNDLADGRAADDARMLSMLLAYDPVIDLERLASEGGLNRERVSAALAHLAAAGQVGYDAAEAAYFHRVLPWNRDRVAAMHPRLIDARDLVERGAVTLESPERAVVVSNGSDHVVRRGETEMICTCPWFAQHRSSRGPCKHVLAVQLVRRRST